MTSPLSVTYLPFSSAAITKPATQNKAIPSTIMMFFMFTPLICLPKPLYLLSNPIEISSPIFVCHIRLTFLPLLITFPFVV